jgi:hypothetical protein
VLQRRQAFTLTRASRLTWFERQELRVYNYVLRFKLAIAGSLLHRRQPYYLHTDGCPARGTGRVKGCTCRRPRSLSVGGQP